jgi:ParB family chromosome partitioning protein
MAQNFGLGRGLASLIPSKKTTLSDNDKNQPEAGKITEPRKDFNYLGGNSFIQHRMPMSDSLPMKNDSGNRVSKSEENITQINITDIVSNPYQPRKIFEEAKLLELAESIKEHGIIQPIIVSRKGKQYEIIAGERRFLAAKIAGLKTLPAIIREAGDQQKLELAVVENIQRQDLNPLEEAKAYLEMSKEFNLTQEEVAKKTGKSRSVVANKIRLLQLPAEIQKALVEGKITEGHAKLLLAIPNPEKQRAFYEMIIKNDLTVRQTEDKTKEITVRRHKRNISIDPELRNIEDKLSQTFGTKVKVAKSGSGGKIIIEYYSQEELNGILDKMK